MLGAAPRRHLVERARRVRARGRAAVATASPVEIAGVVDSTGQARDSRRREGVAVGYGHGKKRPCLKSGRIGVHGRPVYVQVFGGNRNPEAVLFGKALAVVRWRWRRYRQRRGHWGMATA